MYVFGASQDSGFCSFFQQKTTASPESGLAVGERSPLDGRRHVRAVIIAVPSSYLNCLLLDGGRSGPSTRGQAQNFVGQCTGKDSSGESDSLFSTFLCICTLSTVRSKIAPAELMAFEHPGSLSHS